MMVEIALLAVLVVGSGLLINALVLWVPLRMHEEEGAGDQSALTSYWQVLRSLHTQGLLTVVITTLVMGVILFFYWRYGLTLKSLAWMTFYSLLLALAAIDLNTTFLPDALTLPLLWLGLLAQLFPETRTVGPGLAIAGAIGGYLPLWLLAQAYRQLRKREGLGFGDLKLLAALGAWLGPLPLPWILFVASALSLFPVALQAIRGRKGLMQQEYPFGPWIVLGAVLVSSPVFLK